MREIKFRAWDKRHKKWIADWVVSSYEHPLDLGAELMDEDIEPLELQQYTGLKDRNGKEIYEGDIVKYLLSQKGKIVWVDEHARFAIDWITNRSALRKKGSYVGEYINDIEVIGNIHENPELLKAKL